MSARVFRFAPSPNGELHLGHAYSALLNARLAAEVGGRLLLRIEDTDLGRCRPEYVSGILADLAWLGLTWEEPVRVQSEHFADYDLNLRRLYDIGVIYPCFCSRRHAAATGLSTSDPDGQQHYGGTCRAMSRRDSALRIAHGDPHGWRLDSAACGDSAAAKVWGDAVIARRQGGSSYHIAVVVDDAIQGITDVVRGIDIEPATLLHRLLQKLLDLPSPNYVHHRLILDSSGRKLSKSARSPSLRQLRDSGISAAAIRRQLGFS
jgi:glutamyl-Q tRNA(Asp) synthetase